tara:strand:+ start:796 stop:1188 length:393 start_codon:yes stop_codon:yes gene_type:complete
VSGVHICHGAIESLNANPINKKTSPRIIAGFIAFIFKSCKFKLPDTPYIYTTPVRKIPVEKEAKIKYLNAASRLNFPLPKAIRAMIGKDDNSKDKYIVIKSIAIITNKEPTKDNKIRLINSDLKDIWFTI